MASLFPLNAFARAVVDRLLYLGDVTIGNFSIVHVCACIVRLGKVIAVEAKILRVCVGAQAAACAVIFDNMNFATHAVKIRKLNRSSSFCRAKYPRVLTHQ